MDAGAQVGGRRLVAAALPTAAVGEATVRALATVDSDRAVVALALVTATLLALATTLPAVVLEPLPAAVAGTALVLLSLIGFRTLTVAAVLAELLVLYRVGRSGEPHEGWHVPGPWLAAPFLPFALARAGSTDYPAVLTLLLAGLAPVAAWGGLTVRARGEANVHRAARRAIAETLVEHTARGERVRIARELHDVVAHHISMISVQAETARLTTPGLPAAGADRLAEIGATARAGLTEMRRLLGVLRVGDEPTVADRHPQPGLQQLNELVDGARDASGATIRLILSGCPVPLDPGTELAAYRIVQEALTNARRHAPGAAVDVELTFDADRLRLRIRDNGPGPRAGAVGHGLAGMRERAVTAGGTLTAGAVPGAGGFQVEVELPTGDADR